MQYIISWGLVFTNRPPSTAPLDRPSSLHPLFYWCFPNFFLPLSTLFRLLFCSLFMSSLSYHSLLHFSFLDFCSSPIHFFVISPFLRSYFFSPLSIFMIFILFYIVLFLNSFFPFLASFSSSFLLTFFLSSLSIFINLRFSYLFLFS